MARFDIAPFLRIPARQRSTVHFRKNELIFSQGDRGNSVFYIEAGIVKLTVTSTSGKEALLGFYDGGHLVGELCLGGNQPTRRHNAIAVTQVRALRIHRGPAIRLLRSEPKVTYAVLNWSLSRSAEIQEDIVKRLLQSSEEQLAGILSSLAQLGIQDQTGLVPRLTQQDLANMTGLSRQRVNVLVTRLKKFGVADQGGSPERRRHGEERRRKRL